MITIEQITAEPMTALSPQQVLALRMLVQSYDEYRKNLGVYPDFLGEVAKEVALPTERTQGLRAVLTALSRLPRLKVESQGTDKSPSFFSTKQNWDTLAQDALNVLYELPIYSGDIRFVVVQPNITLNSPYPRNRPFFIL